MSCMLEHWERKQQDVPKNTLYAKQCDEGHTEHVMNGAPGQIQTTPLLTLNEGHGEEEDDEQEGYAPRPMDGTLGVSGARAEQFGQDAMALPPNVIHLRLLVGVGGVCCVVVCCVVRHCYCYCGCFCFCWTSDILSMQGSDQSDPSIAVGCRPAAGVWQFLSLWSRCVLWYIL